MKTTKDDRQELRRPKWIKDSMTVLQAANQAHQRHMYLRVHYVEGMGTLVVAVPK